MHVRVFLILLVSVYIIKWYIKKILKGFLGTAFIPVKKDISGNVQKVNAKFVTNKEDLKYLQDLIDSDLANNNNQLGVATEGLLWLKRLKIL